MLLLDEPFSALDSHLKGQVQAEMVELLKLYRGEVLMVTHSIDEAYKYCKNLVIIDKGKSVLFENTKEIFKEPKLISAAKLIGCRNISKCSIKSNNKIYAQDWDIELKLDKKAFDAKYIGIHSNSFVIYQSKDEENIIECEVVELIEKVYGYTIIFRSKGSNTDSNMYFDVKKETWENRKDKTNLYLKVDEETILLLN